MERKGLGHPDSMCDAMMEAISVALCQAYLDTTGRVLHHNVDAVHSVGQKSAENLSKGATASKTATILESGWFISVTFRSNGLSINR